MKNLLAIDTSTEMASVSLLLGKELISKEQGSQRTHAQLLLPMIDELCQEASLALSQLDGIIFGCGPGSFTGLRIACSVAKGLGYAHDIGLIPVSTLGAIAFAVRSEQQIEMPILAVLDARMQQLYWGYFASKQEGAQEQVSFVEDIQLPNHERFIIAGLGIDSYWADFPDALKDQMTSKISMHPHASAMIGLALEMHISPVSAQQAQPIYVRNQVVQV